MSRVKKRYVVNFPGHLANCEFNYRRLRRLMSGWPVTPKAQVENEAKGIDETNSKEWRFIIGQNKNNEIALLLNVSESAKYTTTVHIAVHQRLQNQMSWSKYLQSVAKQAQGSDAENQFSMADIKRGVTMLPKRLSAYSLEVRLYHDASVAEVIGWEGHRRIQARNEYPNRNMYQSDEKAQLNRFLGELLELCLAQGRILDEVVITQ